MTNTGRFSVGKGSILLPMDADAKALAANVGDIFDVERVPDRDMYFQRRMFATIGELADAVGESREWMRYQLLVFTGNFHVVGTLDGKHVVAVKSMSRRSMNDEEFKQFWEDAKQPIEKRVLPLVRDEVLRGQLHEAVHKF